MRVSIGAKLWMGFTLILLVLLVVGVTSCQSTTRATETTRWVAHTHQVLAKLAGLFSTQQDGETGQRGYLRPYPVAARGGSLRGIGWNIQKESSVRAEAASDIVASSTEMAASSELLRGLAERYRG